MLRLLPLLALALLPAAVAAPVPPGGRPAFGAGGLLSHADLESVRFDSRPVKDGEKYDELKPAEEVVKESKPAKVRPKNRYDVAVLLPWVTFREGEPARAYFVLRNNRGSPLGLDARLSLFGPEPGVWNSCGIDVRDVNTGKPVFVIGLSGCACGGGSLVDVPADGFYCVAGDLGRCADGTPLPPGEYEVDWHYSSLRSAPVRFSVLKGDGAKPVALKKRAGLRYFHVEPEFDSDERPEKAGEPFRWPACVLNTVYADELATALAVGQGGVYVPDIHTIPAADKLVEASAEWRPYRDGDRLIVTLRAAAPHKQVRFAEAPQLHVQVESRADERFAPMLEEAMKLAEVRDNDAVLTTPLTIEARLPTGWRDRCGVSGTACVAVLISAGRIELPRGVGLERAKVNEAIREERTDRPPVWGGIVRTDFTELHFPLPLMNPAP